MTLTTLAIKIYKEKENAFINIVNVVYFLFFLIFVIKLGRSMIEIFCSRTTKDRQGH